MRPLRAYHNQHLIRTGRDCYTFAKRRSFIRNKEKMAGPDY